MLKIVRSLILVLACVLFSSCQGRLQSAQPVQPGEPITLTFWTLQLSTFKDTLEPMFRAYEQSHPRIRIQWVDVPFSEGEKKALTAIMSGQVPDVINLNPDFSAVLASRGAILNMNDWVAPEVQQTYLPVAWQAVTLLPSGHQKPFAFGLPWYLTSKITFYNQSVLQKAGLTRPPKTYDELEAMAKVLRASGQYLLMPSPSENGQFLKELNQLGIPLFDAAGAPIFTRDSRSLAHLKRWVRLYQSHMLPPEALTEGHRSAVDRFQAGTLGMLFAGPNFLKIIQENAPIVFQSTQVSPQFPQTSVNRSPEFAAMILAVPKKSVHPKEAVDFALFITNEANQLALAKAAPVLPSVKKALQTSFFQVGQAEDLVSRARVLSARQLLSATVAFQIQPMQKAINERVNLAVEMALLGKCSPEKALKSLEDSLKQI